MIETLVGRFGSVGKNFSGEAQAKPGGATTPLGVPPCEASSGDWKRLLRNYVCFGTATLCVARLTAAEIRVPADVPTIQGAIGVASAGDTVLVAPGTYPENLNFLGKAITVTSEVGATDTVIDGQKVDHVVRFANGETRSSVLVGFTLRNGHGFDGGGGVSIKSSSPSVISNIIAENVAECCGLGVSIENGSPLLQYNVISSNRELLNSAFGGGIYAQGPGSPLILNNTITNHYCAVGAGIFLSHISGVPVIAGNFIARNVDSSSGPDGAGITVWQSPNAMLLNNVVVNNSSGIEWDSFFETGFPQMINNTIAGNAGFGVALGGWSLAPLVANNIVSAPEGAVALEVVLGGDPSLWTVRNNIFFESGTAVTGDLIGMSSNIFANPLFADPAMEDYHLLRVSPAVDAAWIAVAATNDFDGVARPINGDRRGQSEADIGAFEYVPQSPIPPSPVGAISGDRQLTVWWKPSADATWYEVKRAVANTGSYETVGRVTATNYVDKPLENGTEYSYVVIAFSDLGKSSNSVSFSGIPGNFPPLARDDTASTLENASVTIDVLANDTDPNGDPLQVASVTQPLRGWVVTDGATVVYTPEPKFFGVDQFTYIVGDGRGAISTGAVAVTIVRLNHPPVAFDQFLTILGDTEWVSFNVPAFDLDFDPLTFQLLSLPTNGLLLAAFSEGIAQMAYRPAHAFAGVDCFWFRASDGLTNGLPAKVTLTVLPPRDADGDGIPDYWAAIYNVSGRDDDPDLDGLTNYQEYLANTNPHDAKSVLRITELTRGVDGNPAITWNSIGGTRYRIQASDGATGEDGAWIFHDVTRPAYLEIDPRSRGAPSAMSFTDTTNSATNRYYRISVVGH